MLRKTVLPMRGVLAGAVLLASPLPAVAQADPDPAACDRVAGWTAGDARVVASTFVATGRLELPQTGLATLAGLPGLDPAGHTRSAPNPPFCRVTLKLAPSSDSDITVEVWLPASGWNGKFAALGNFGWAGSPMYAGMIGPLQKGYATASTDTGHDDSNPDQQGGRFVLGHPEKYLDYAYRASHAMTVVAKQLIESFYGQTPARSYWVGCSLGGLEGLIEAKRFPGDFDGIVVGAPPNPLASFNAAQLWPGWLVAQNPSGLIPKEKYALVHQAVMRACGSPHEIAEDVLERPDQCAFDPGQLLCREGDGPDCLSAAQVELLRGIYAGPVNPRTGEAIFPGPAYGAELDFPDYAAQKPFANALDLFRYVVFADPEWQPNRFDWDADMARASEQALLLSVDADLGSFFARGGKLLLYIGGNDYHNPAELVAYQQRLIASSGVSARDAVRLFVIPGMGHCFGGTGCDTFDKLGAIDDWVSRGKAPDHLVAAKVAAGGVVRTRPLCAYPQVARYRGTGDSDTAASYLCAQP